MMVKCLRVIEMTRQQRIKSKSGYYHIMLRGNERKNIFLDNEDKLRFIETMKQKKFGNRFYLHAFCLMDNHIHLMISEGTEDIAKVIKRIAVSYVFYFNKKYKRVGHLFQDRFRSEIMDEDGYILSLARYIHQNPVKANMAKSPEDYKWSSYNGYLDEGYYISKGCLDREVVMGLFSNNQEKAQKLFIKYMDEDNEDCFLDLMEDEEPMDEDEAKILYEELLIKRGINLGNDFKLKIPDELIREYRELSKLSIRKIAGITKLNKDKVNKILKGI